MEWFLLSIIVVWFVWRLIPKKGIRNVSTEQLKDMIHDRSKQLIDVRTPAEYKSRHIQQFVNIPLNRLPSKLSKLDPSKETVVICQSGMRSARAASLLKKAGFSNVVNVRGGMNAW